MQFKTISSFSALILIYPRIKPGNEAQATRDGNIAQGKLS